MVLELRLALWRHVQSRSRVISRHWFRNDQIIRFRIFFLSLHDSTEYLQLLLLV